MKQLPRELDGLKIPPRRKIDPRKGIIISYPRSGLNWVRYCVEYLTCLRTPGPKKLFKEGELAFYRSHKVNASDGPQSWNCAFLDEQGKPLHNKAVLLLRDYRESFLRHSQHLPHLHNSDTIVQGKLGKFKHYLVNLEAFDKFQGPKLLVRYDDLIKDFNQVVGILDFLELPYGDISNFDVEYHRQNSVTIYDTEYKSFTKNNLQNFKFHQDNVEPEVIKSLEFFVKEKHPELWGKYLQ